MRHIKNVIAAALLLLPLALVPFGAHADGMSSLKSFYKQTQAVRADFHQLVTDRQGRKVQEVYGAMQLKRPNKFRWDYSKPFEQQIISDGERVWLYDIELAQVTVRPLGKALGSSPAALLAGNSNYEKNFKLKTIISNDGIDWVSANPNDAESGFEKILIGFKNNLLQEMQLVDSFGHQTKIVFSQLENNPAINNQQFLFKPPLGVDVVGE